MVWLFFRISLAGSPADAVARSAEGREFGSEFSSDLFILVLLSALRVSAPRIKRGAIALRQDSSHHTRNGTDTQAGQKHTWADRTRALPSNRPSKRARWEIPPTVAVSY